jgi:hypothetical protein
MVGLGGLAPVWSGVGDIGIDWDKVFVGRDRFAAMIGDDASKGSCARR